MSVINIASIFLDKNHAQLILELEKWVLERKTCLNIKWRLYEIKGSFWFVIMPYLKFKYWKVSVLLFDKPLQSTICGVSK